MRLLLTALFLAAMPPSSGAAAELSASDIRAFLANIGVNPGTVKDGGERVGLQMLTAVSVERGVRSGDFVVRLSIRPVHGK